MGVSLDEGDRLQSTVARWVDEEAENADSVLRTLNALTKSLVAECNFFALAATPVAPRDVLLAISSRVGMLIVPIIAAAVENDAVIF